NNTDNTKGPLLATVTGTGRKFSNWVTSSTGSVQLWLESGCQAQSFPLLGCVCATSNSRNGFMMEGYQYRRRQSGTSAWFFTPLRYPGQYHDEETDLYENWNRYYDPTIGRYLQPMV